MICAEADACVVAPPPVIETIGWVVYPVPPLVTLIDITEPVTDTVAAADSPSYSQSTVPKVTTPPV